MDKIDNLIKVATDEADAMFFDLLEQYPELDADDPRMSAVLMSMMTNCIIQLHARGFTERDLVNHVFDFCELSRQIQDDIDDELDK